MTRREYGAGSVYQRASDGLWVGTIEAGWTEKGIRRRITVSAKTKQQAQRKLRDRRSQIDREGDAGTAVRTTVKTFADKWLEEQAGVLAPNTLNNTATSLRKWIIPTIGHKRFDMLTPDDVKAVTKKMRAAGRSKSTQTRTHSVLTTMLKAATADSLPVPHRLLVVKGPGKGKNDRKDMPVPEALAVLREASYLPHGSRYLTALLEARRQAECLGLCWDYVDFDRELIQVEWQLQALPYNVRYDRTSGFRVPQEYECRQLNGALHLVRPKTEAGHTVIPMVEPVRDALWAWKEISSKLIPHNPHGLVWPDLDGNPTIRPTDDTEWYALQGAASLATHDDYTGLGPVPVGHPSGRYYTIHETKHTTVTLLLEAGVPDHVIIAIAGHAAWSSSKTYAHVNLEPARAALAAVAERLALSPQDPPALGRGAGGSLRTDRAHG